MDTPPGISESVAERLRDAKLRIQCCGGHLWRRVLTEEERQRLGGNLAHAYREYGTAGMWQKLRGVSEWRAVIEAAEQLDLMSAADRKWLLREIGEDCDDVERAIEKRVATGDLVLVERPRSAYWESKHIEVNWSRQAASWEYFYELCRHAKQDQPIDSALFERTQKGAYVTKMKSHLRRRLKGFPKSLINLIKYVGRGTQKLDLPPERIHMFVIEATEALRELTG